MQLRTATRQRAKLKISLGGTAGSGKTYSALLLASGIVPMDKVCLIDTENCSGDLYADLGPYNVITLIPPFTPERYIEAIKTAKDGGMEVIIIDSVTHVWKGEGGLLEYNSSLGGRFQDWAKTTPRYQKWLNAILQTDVHFICTTRKKTAYEMSKDEKGNVRVEKKGLDDEIRDGFDYEMTIAFDLSQKHLAIATKDRTSIFMDQPEFVISTETGQILKDWAEKGVDPIRVIEPVKPTTPPKPPQTTVSQNPSNHTTPAPKALDDGTIEAFLKRIDVLSNVEDANKLYREILTWADDDKRKRVITTIILKGKELRAKEAAENEQIVVPDDFGNEEKPDEQQSKPKTKKTAKAKATAKA